MTRMKFERLRRNLNQTALGRQVGLPQADVSRMERCFLIPTPSQLMALCHVLDVAASELFKDAVIVDAVTPSPKAQRAARVRESVGLA